jgi:hypothetical protein
MSGITQNQATLLRDNKGAAKKMLRAKLVEDIYMDPRATPAEKKKAFEDTNRIPVAIVNEFRQKALDNKSLEKTIDKAIIGVARENAVHANEERKKAAVKRELESTKSKKTPGGSRRRKTRRTMKRK